MTLQTLELEKYKTSKQKETKNCHHGLKNNTCIANCRKMQPWKPVNTYFLNFRLDRPGHMFDTVMSVEALDVVRLVVAHLTVIDLGRVGQLVSPQMRQPDRGKAALGAL